MRTDDTARELGGGGEVVVFTEIMISLLLLSNHFILWFSEMEETAPSVSAQRDAGFKEFIHVDNEAV